jgi:hypothetical protein
MVWRELMERTIHGDEPRLGAPARALAPGPTHDRDGCATGSGRLAEGKSTLVSERAR